MNQAKSVNCLRIAKKRVKDLKDNRKKRVKDLKDTRKKSINNLRVLSITTSVENKIVRPCQDSKTLRQRKRTKIARYG